MPTEPQQDRNVEVRANECPNCGQPDGQHHNLCQQEAVWELQESVNQLEEKINEMNSRPSQPPQNVEGGDAAKGVASEAIMQKWNDPEWRKWAEVNSEVEYLRAEMAVTVGTERAMHNAWRKRADEAETRLALSATSDDAKAQRLKEAEDLIRDIDNYADYPIIPQHQQRIDAILAQTPCDERLE